MHIRIFSTSSLHYDVVEKLGGKITQDETQPSGLYGCDAPNSYIEVETFSVDVDTYRRELHKKQNLWSGDFIVQTTKHIEKNYMNKRSV